MSKEPCGIDELHCLIGLDAVADICAVVRGEHQAHVEPYAVGTPGEIDRNRNIGISAWCDISHVDW